MTEVEFGFHMDRLKKVYGVKAYPDERTEQIWLRNKWRHAQVFSDAIDTVIGDNAHPPMLGKIIEAVAASQRKFPELEADPYKPIREQIHQATHEKSVCHRCGNTGVIECFRKYYGLTQSIMFCRCSAAEVARKLPDFRGARVVEAHDPFYVIFWFDPNKSEKFQIYKDLYFDSVAEATPKLSELYYSHDINMDPCYWRPDGQVPPSAFLSEIRYAPEKSMKEQGPYVAKLLKTNTSGFDHES